MLRALLKYPPEEDTPLLSSSNHRSPFAMLFSLLSTSLLALAAADLPDSWTTRYSLMAVHSGTPEVHLKEVKIDSSTGSVALDADTEFTIGFPHDQLLIYKNGAYTDLSFSVAVTNTHDIYATNSTNLPTHFSVADGILQHDFSGNFTVCLDDLTILALDSEAPGIYCKNPLSDVVIAAIKSD